LSLFPPVRNPKGERGDTTTPLFTLRVTKPTSHYSSIPSLQHSPHFEAMTEQPQVEERLRQLREEYEKGQQMLAELQAQEADLQQKLLRISGAIQVLEELLSEAAASPPPPGTGTTVMD